ncbi:hypothetical protein Pan216_22210 [Planctomycetes bacterium Pan216]|uniref:Uncharacterized protein n=1 Tax=Kolteria novifilia TaxID=2527975 RepID=A0A518B312_9BACT|nr:hypothetical protein Pan216_22210 [Planctomycetes bacterium Pan216]
MKRLSLGIALGCLCLALVAPDTLAGPRGRSGGARRSSPSSPSGRTNRSNYVSPERRATPERRSTPSERGRTPGNANPGQRFEGLQQSNPAMRTERGAANAGNVESFLGLNPQNANRQPGQAQERFRSAYETGPKPFSPSWYAQHPNAWKVTHPNADVWLAAQPNRLGRWIGVPVAGAGGTTVVESSYGTGESAVVSDAPAEQTTTASTTDSATESDTTASADQSQNFMTIGIYGLVPAGEAEATRMVQLTTDPEGTIRGTYFDVLTQNKGSLSGQIDKSTRAVSWTLGENGKVTFNTTLDDLTKPESKVSVDYPNGKKSTWQMVMMQEQQAG